MNHHNSASNENNTASSSSLSIPYVCECCGYDNRRPITALFPATDEKLDMREFKTPKNIYISGIFLYNDEDDPTTFFIVNRGMAEKQKCKWDRYSTLYLAPGETYGFKCSFEPKGNLFLCSDILETDCEVHNNFNGTRFTDDSNRRIDLCKFPYDDGNCPSAVFCKARYLFRSETFILIEDPITTNKTFCLIQSIKNDRLDRWQFLPKLKFNKEYLFLLTYDVGLPNACVLDVKNIDSSPISL